MNNASGVLYGERARPIRPPGGMRGSGCVGADGRGSVCRRCLTGLVAVALLGNATPAGADELNERVAFAEQRLDESRQAAWRWQTGWTSVYAGVALVQGTLALTGDDSDGRVANGVGALRAVTAVTLMRLRPDPGRHGADPVRAAGPAGSPERLAAAEQLLEESAHHAAERYSARRHALNIGINAVFGGLIWAFGDRDDAIVSTLVGIAGGEAALLTRSRKPIRNLEAYRAGFPGRIELMPLQGAAGIAFRARF